MSIVDARTISLNYTSVIFNRKDFKPKFHYSIVMESDKFPVWRIIGTNVCNETFFSLPLKFNDPRGQRLEKMVLANNMALVRINLVHREPCARTWKIKIG